MIHLTTSQTYISIIYIIAFSLILALLVHASDPSATKTSKHYWTYFTSTLIIAIIFLALGDAILGLVAHIKGAAFILVTLKFQPSQNRYANHGSDKLSDDEAAMLSAHFESHTPIYGYYEYNLIDDKNNMERFNCVNPDLLGYLKALHATKPLANDVKQENYTTEELPIKNNDIADSSNKKTPDRASSEVGD